MEKEFNKQDSFFRRLVTKCSRFIDIPTAFAGAMIMGVIVGYINRKFGIWPASVAAMKQAVYTFFFGGMLTRLLFIISDKIDGVFKGTFISAFIVTVITVLMVYAVHSMKGTPRPMESTIPTAVMAPFGFSYLAYKRKKRR